MRKILYLLLLLPIGMQAQNVPDIIRTTPIPATGSNKNNRATVDANLKAMYALLLPRVTSNTINGAKDSSGYLFYNVITDRVVSARSMNVFDVLARVSDLNAYVPYNGATGGVNLGNNGLVASSFRAYNTDQIGVSYQFRLNGFNYDHWSILSLNATKRLRFAKPQAGGGINDTVAVDIDYNTLKTRFYRIADGITPPDTASKQQFTTAEWVRARIAAATGGVSSFNGRTGSVTPFTGDYAAFYSDLTSSQSIGGIKTYTTGLRSSTTPSVATDVVRLSDLGNYVTTNTNQTIATGSKTWAQNQTFQATALFNETNHTGQSLYESGSSIAYRSTSYTAGKWSFLMSNSDILFQKAGFTGGAGNMTDVQYLFGSDRLRRNGITLLETGDLTPYATLSSPALTGTPTAPTATTGTNTTQLATTSFVLANSIQTIGVAQGVTTTGGVNPTIGLGNITPSSVGMTSVSPALGGLSASSLYLQRNIADRSNAIRSYTGTSVDWIYGDDAVTGDWYIERYSGGSAVDRPFRLNKATGIPAFLYSPTMPTATTGDNTTKGASTAFVQQELTASGRTRAFLNSNITLALNGDYLSTTSTLYTGVLPPTTGFLTDGSKLIVVAATGTAGARISCPTGYTLVGLSGAATPGTGGVNIVNGGKVQLAPVGTNAYQYYALSGTVIVN